MNKIAYIENGIGYIHENQLPKCGCGGKPIANFEIYKDKFINVEIYCSECGITTGICDYAEIAISIWMKAFGKFAQSQSYIGVEDDICLAASSHFGQEDF